MKNTVIVVATIAMWAVVGVMMFKNWANEPTISEAEHQQYIASLVGKETAP